METKGRPNTPKRRTDRQLRWNSQPLELWREKYANGRFVELDGHLTHYIEKGEGPATILLHGWFHDSQMWNRNIDVLATKFKVYAIDLWGFGYSTRELMDWGYPLYAGQLLRFMDTLGIGRASLVGQSMGAGTATLFCTQNRERVDKLVLVSSAGLPNPSPQIDEATMQHCLKRLILDEDDSRRVILKTMFVYDEGSISDGFFEDLTRFHEIRGTNDVLIGSLRKNFFDTLLPEIDRLKNMDVPVLIVWGRQDRAVGFDLGEKLHLMLKDSRLEVIEKAAHCANYEQPDRFNAVVSKFLSESDPNRGGTR